MTIKELKDKLKDLPDDAKVEFNVDLKINDQSSSIRRAIDILEYSDKNTLVTLKSWWSVKFFY